MPAGYDPKGPIFISYRQSDGRSHAAALDSFLRSGGLVPWRDLVDLPPGETAQRVTEAFEEGISNAVLIVTKQLGDSQFVPQTELPPLLEMDADTGGARPFHLLILNTIAKSDGAGAEINVDAPDDLLSRSGHWPPTCDGCGLVTERKLRNLKQYALLPGLLDERRQLYADLLDARLTARIMHLADKEVSIQTQTRPQGNARSRLSGTNRSAFIAKDADDPYDLIIRLRQDRHSGVPSEESMRCLQDTLPLMVDGLYGHGVERVRLDAAGHPVLLWAIGAALPTTRMRLSSMVVEDIHGNRWYDQLPAKNDGRCEHAAVKGGAVAPSPYRADRADELDDGRLFAVSFCPRIDRLSTSGIAQDRLTRAVVLLEFDSKGLNERAFTQMVERGAFDLTLKVKIAGGENAPRFIPSAEGARLAARIMGGLREMVNRTGIDEIHIVSNLPAALAPLLGRQSNTLNLVLHEWGIGANGNREYLPVARIQPGMPGGPITEVFQQSGKVHPWQLRRRMPAGRLRSKKRGRSRRLSVNKVTSSRRRRP